MNTNISDADVERAAKAAHEVNRAYCEGIGDTSQVSWEDAPEWQRDSAREGVRTLIKNPKLSAEDMHKAWVEVKAMQGWTYGETKDEEAKRHPCMVPYEQLPLQQRAKDDLFGFVVRLVLLSGEP